MYEHVYAGLGGGRLLPHAAILRLRTDLCVRLPARLRPSTCPPAWSAVDVGLRSPASTVTLVSTEARHPDDRARDLRVPTMQSRRFLDDPQPEYYTI